jgi:viroplasmin and RNaseH domain-containing protein
MTDIDGISDSNQIDESSGIIDGHVSELMKYFDTVQILCTRYIQSEGTTQHYSNGMGNVMARVGYARQWVVNEEREIQIRMDDQIK